MCEQLLHMTVAGDPLNARNRNHCTKHNARFRSDKRCSNTHWINNTNNTTNLHSNSPTCQNEQKLADVVAAHIEDQFDHFAFRRIDEIFSDRPPDAHVT